MAFPINPVEGDTYTENNTVWIYSAVTGQWNRSIISQVNETTYIGSDGAPGGIGGNTQVIFNDNGSLASDAGLVYNKTTDALTTGSLRATSLGTAAAPTFTFTGDPNTGIYSPGADQVAISTAGTGRLFVDASGNVGIKNSAPSTVLYSGGASLALGTTGVTSTIRIGDASEIAYNGNLQINNFAATATIFYTTNTERMRLTAAGLLGLGTSSPAEVLDVNGNIAFGASFAGRIRTKNAGGGSAAGTVEISAPNETTTRGVSFGNNYYITASNTYAQTATNIGGSAVEFRATNANYGEILFRQKQDPDLGGAERTPLVISTEGRVGIGTTSPESGSLATVQGRITLIENAATYLRAGTTADVAYFDTATTGTVKPLVFNLSATERARIDSSGRLLIGTSTSADFESLIQTAQTTGVGAFEAFQFSNNTAYPFITFAKSRGASVGTNTIVQNGDTLGEIVFRGADGTNYDTAASITAFVDGEPGTAGDATDMPGRLVFSTTSDGAASPTERLRITSAGVLQVADAGNITVGTTTGTKIGTATTQKIGFYNATPVVQPAAVADATDAATVITQLNDLLAKLRTLGIIAT